MVYEYFSKYLFKRHASPKTSNIKYFWSFMCDYMMHRREKYQRFLKSVCRGLFKRNGVKYPLLIMHNYHRSNSELVPAFKLLVHLGGLLRIEEV